MKTRIKIRRLDVEIEGDGLNMRMVAVNAEGNGPGMRAALRGLVEALDFRESGDSIPPAAGRDPLEIRASDLRPRRRPPVLNKSGGSEVIASVVTVRCPTCEFEFSAAAVYGEVKGVRCPRCGQKGKPA